MAHPARTTTMFMKNQRSGMAWKKTWGRQTHDEIVKNGRSCILSMVAVPWYFHMVDCSSCLCVQIVVQGGQVVVRECGGSLVDAS